VNGQQLVAAFAGVRQRLRRQGSADAPLGEVWQVKSVVAPPSAVIVPEVMVRVGAGDPDCEPGSIHNAFTFPSTHQGAEHRKTKQPLPASGGGIVVREGLFFEALVASHIGQVSLSGHRGWLQQLGCYSPV
jgi:hypothetical protein